MKKALICAMFCMPLLMNAQKNGKLQLGVEYGLSKSTNDSGILAIDARFRIINVGIVNFNAGASLGYMTPHLGYTFGFVANPNVTAEFGLFNFRLCPYLGIGYSYATQKFGGNGFYTNYDPIVNGETQETIASSGYTIHPGLRYYFEKLIYLDAGLKRTSGTVKGSSRDFHSESNVIFIGAGFHF